MSEDDQLEAPSSRRADVGVAVGSSVVGAAVGLIGGPVGALVGAAVAPLVQASGSALVRRRLEKFGSRVEQRGVSVDELVIAAIETPEDQDLLRDAVEAATKTDNDAKIRVLADALVAGVLSQDEVERATARRVVRVFSRIDSVEANVLGLLHRNGETDVSTLRTLIGVGDAALIDACMAVLISEGLAVDRAGNSKYRVTDFGVQLASMLEVASEADPGD